MFEHFIISQLEKRRLKFNKMVWCTAHVHSSVKTAVHGKDIDYWMSRCSTRLVERSETLKTKIVAAIEAMTSEMLNMLG
jgi:hypothetical protein